MQNLIQESEFRGNDVVLPQLPSGEYGYVQDRGNDQAPHVAVRPI